MPRAERPSPEEWDGQGDEGDEEGEAAPEAGFERIRRSTGKAPTVKSDRRQQSKEWGKQISKFQRERKRHSGGKP